MKLLARRIMKSFYLFYSILPNNSNYHLSAYFFIIPRMQVTTAVAVRRYDIHICGQPRKRNLFTTKMTMTSEQANAIKMMKSDMLYVVS